MKVVKLNDIIKLVNDAGQDVITIAPTQDGNSFSCVLTNNSIQFRHVSGQNIDISDWKIEITSADQKNNIVFTPLQSVWRFKDYSAEIIIQNGEMLFKNTSTNEVTTVSSQGVKTTKP